MPDDIAEHIEEKIEEKIEEIREEEKLEEIEERLEEVENQIEEDATEDEKIEEDIQTLLETERSLWRTWTEQCEAKLTQLTAENQALSQTLQSVVANLERLETARLPNPEPTPEPTPEPELVLQEESPVGEENKPRIRWV